jgi:hypothetical protein
MSCQSPGNPNQDSFETPPWMSQEKVPLGCRYGGVTQRILYGGRWWLPPNPGRGESCESKVARGSFLAPRMLQKVGWLDAGPSN